MRLFENLFLAKRTRPFLPGAEGYATRPGVRRPVIDLLAQPNFLVRSPIKAIEGAMLVMSPISVINGLGGIQTGGIRSVSLLQNPNSQGYIL